MGRSRRGISRLRRMASSCNFRRFCSLLDWLTVVTVNKRTLTSQPIRFVRLSNFLLDSASLLPFLWRRSLPSEFRLLTLSMMVLNDL
jgi:hypothetical protein